MNALFLPFLVAAMLAAQSVVFGAIADSATRRTDVTFYSGNYRLKGWLVKPAQAGNAKLPAIVMAPGFSGVKECNYQFYADNFAKAGLAVLLFDYPNFGESEGAVRQEVDPWLQVQAYRDGISFLTTDADIDPQRIGVWGGSFSGGHALVVSALDKRVKCVVAMTPFISGSFYMKVMPAEAKRGLVYGFNADRLSRVKGAKPRMIPVVANTAGESAAFNSKNARSFVDNFKGYAPNFKNEVTLKSLEMQLEYEPIAYLPNIDAIPKLFIIARSDEMIPETLIKDAYAKAPEPKKLAYIDGHHFSPYMEKLPEASALAIEWFRTNL